MNVCLAIAAVLLPLLAMPASALSQPEYVKFP